MQVKKKKKNFTLNLLNIEQIDVASRHPMSKCVQGSSLVNS